MNSQHEDSDTVEEALRVDTREFKLIPDTSAQITERAKAACRVEAMKILGDASRWTVHDIKIENRSQFLVGCDINGQDINDGNIADRLRPFVTWDPIPSGGAVVFVVSYTGPVRAGECFHAELATRVSRPLAS